MKAQIMAYAKNKSGDLVRAYTTTGETPDLSPNAPDLHGIPQSSDPDEWWVFLSNVGFNLPSVVKS